MCYYKLTILLFFYSACLISCDDSEQPEPERDPVIETFAGGDKGLKDGMGTTANFDGPYRMAFSPSGEIYVIDQQQRALRKISTTGNVTTIFTDYPKEIITLAVGEDGTVFLAFDYRIGKLLSDGTVEIIVDGHEAPSEWYFHGVTSMAVIPDGSLILFEGSNHRLINISATGEFIAVLCNHPQMFPGGDHNGKLEDIYFADVYDIFVTENGEILFTDSFKQDVRKISVDKMVTTLVGSGYDAPFRFPTAVVQMKDGRIFVAEGRGVAVVDTNGGIWYLGGTQIKAPADLLLSKDNKTMYITNGNSVMKVTF
jgi:hypothetical protein